MSATRLLQAAEDGQVRLAADQAPPAELMERLRAHSGPASQRRMSP